MRIWILIFVVISFELQAQLLPLYSNLNQNNAAYHPAYAGMDHSLSITGTFRSQWSGIIGAPTHRLLSANFPLYVANGGIGVVFESSNTGLRSLNKFKMQYSYQLELGSEILGLGAGLGFMNLRMDGNNYRTPTGSYQDGNFIDHNDNVLTTGIENSGTLGIEAGIYFQGEQFEVGTTISNLNRPVFKFNEFENSINPSISFTSHFRKAINKEWTSISSLLVVSDFETLQSVFTTGFLLRELFFISGGLRGFNRKNGDGMILQSGLKISENWKMLYSYEIGLSGIGRTSSGSHEIGINYNLNKAFGRGIPPRIIYSPRFL
jgi:type IX secretion system PorP/SprF family membrane protein